jgi:hypothetical protein
MSDLLFESNTGAETETLNAFAGNWTQGNFVAQSAHTVSSIKLYLLKVGSPGTDCRVSIRAVDVNHKPTGADLAYADFSGNALTTSMAETEIAIAYSTLVADTEYAIVLRAPSGDGGNYISVSKAAGGTRGLSGDSGATWTTYVGDGTYRHKIYGLGVAYVIAATVGEFVLTGIDVNLLRPARNLIAEVGNYTLTGINIGVARTTTMAVAVGQFILTGINILLTWHENFKNSAKHNSTVTNQNKVADVSPTSSDKNNSTVTNQNKSS